MFLVDTEAILTLIEAGGFVVCAPKPQRPGGRLTLLRGEVSLKDNRPGLTKN